VSAEAGSAVSAWREHRFLQLLLCVVAGIILLPFLAKFRIVLLVIQVLLLNGILVAMSANRRRSVLRRFLFGACAVNIALQAVSLRLPTTVLPHVADAVGAVVLALCVVAILTHVFRSADITADTIFAAMVAYMFLALAFSRAFVIMQAVSPSNFGLREGVNMDLELLYFSFVTIATLGYGDVTPRLPSAQMLAVLEAVIGQFYVAVLIAWLVSVYAGRRRRG
jgi:ion channel